MQQSLSRFARDGFIEKFLLLLRGTARAHVYFEFLGIFGRDIHAGTVQPIGTNVTADVEPK